NATPRAPQRETQQPLRMQRATGPPAEFLRQLPTPAISPETRRAAEGKAIVVTVPPLPRGDDAGGRMPCRVPHGPHREQVVIAQIRTNEDDDVRTQRRDPTGDLLQGIQLTAQIS